jgi:HEAT repeat protein
MSNDHPQLDERSSLQTEEHKDQLADQVSESFVPGDTALTGDQTANEPAQETALEEERIKDEIEIQIDLLKDPDWAVRREAVITLGEMGGSAHQADPFLGPSQSGSSRIGQN